MSTTTETTLDRDAVDKALRKVIEFADYDLHKGIECDEETGADTYSEHVDRFTVAYSAARSVEPAKVDDEPLSRAAVEAAVRKVIFNEFGTYVGAVDRITTAVLNLQSGAK